MCTNCARRVTSCPMCRRPIPELQPLPVSIRFCVCVCTSIFGNHSRYHLNVLSSQVDLEATAAQRAELDIETVAYFNATMMADLMFEVSSTRSARGFEPAVVADVFVVAYFIRGICPR